MKIALCTELRNAEWFESRLRSLFAGDGQLVIDELWNEKQLSQALRRSRYHAVVIAMTGARGLEAAIQAKQLAPETPLVWWSDDENFALIAYHLRIPAFLSADCSDQELYEATEVWKCELRYAAIVRRRKQSPGFFRAKGKVMNQVRRKSMNKNITGENKTVTLYRK